LLTPGGGGTTAESANLPEGEEIEQRADEGDEHHGNADGVYVKGFGEVPGARSEDNGADAHEQAYAVEGDEGAADTLQESENEAGPVEPAEARGGGGVWLFLGNGLRLYGFGHG
jgi:hypothetical protein